MKNLKPFTEICAWCGTLIKEHHDNLKEVIHGEEHLSHGMCEECAKTWGK